MTRIGQMISKNFRESWWLYTLFRVGLFYYPFPPNMFMIWRESLRIPYFYELSSMTISELNIIAYHYSFCFIYSKIIITFVRKMWQIILIRVSTRRYNYVICSLDYVQFCRTYYKSSITQVIRSCRFIICIFKVFTYPIFQLINSKSSSDVSETNLMW